MFGCGKDGGVPYDDGSGSGGGGGGHVFVPDDTIPPQIEIYTPVVDQVFRNGSVINITGKLTDDYGLYQGTIKVVNNFSGVVLLNQPYEIHGFLSYNFNLNHTVAAPSAADYTVTVSFQDHGLNIATKSVKVKVTP